MRRKITSLTVFPVRNSTYTNWYYREVSLCSLRQPTFQSSSSLLRSTPVHLPIEESFSVKSTEANLEYGDAAVDGRRTLPMVWLCMIIIWKSWPDMNTICLLAWCAQIRFFFIVHTLSESNLNFLKSVTNCFDQSKEKYHYRQTMYHAVCKSWS